MKELLQGRRLGFALRPVFGQLALGMAFAALLLDLGAWFAWGTRETNAFVWGAYWLAIAAALNGLLAFVAALAELRDVPDEERSLARIDLAVVVLATAAAALSAAIRSGELGAAGASPAPLLLGALSLLAFAATAFIGGDLYAPREWEEIQEELPRERHSRRRTAPR